MATELLIKINGVVDVASARRVAPVVPEPEPKDGDDIVEYAWKQKVKKVGEGPDDYVVYEEMEEVSRVNRKAYIEANCSDIGVLAVLEKVRRSGDITLLNQTGGIIPEGLQDYTNVPDNIGDALKAVANGAQSFEGLKAIFGDLSFNDLAQLNADQIKVYLDNYVAANKATEGDK